MILRMKVTISKRLTKLSGMKTLQQVEDEAMQLTEADREALASRLLDSLSGEAITEIDRAWSAEADRRYQEIASGRSKPLTEEQVFHRLLSRR